MAIKLGTSDISKVYLGATEVSKIYLGSTEVYSSFSYLLDTYTGADVAYSLRKLRSAYSGNCVRVRRSSDSTELNIGFVNNVLDTASLLTFTGAGDGFVTTWYDQSTNAKNAAVSTATEQPQIVSSGAMISGGIDFDGGNYLFNASSIAYSGGVSFFSVQNLVNLTGRLWSDDITGAQGNFIANADSPIQLNDNGNGYEDITLPSFTINTEQLASFTFNDSNGDYSHSINGSSGTGNLSTWTGPIAPSGSANIGIMAAGNSGQYGTGKLKELVIYPNNQASNSSGIKTNINNYYGSY